MFNEGAVPTAKAVANFFLEKGWNEGVPIDHLKLQKLVYYAHGWHLANDLGPLFPDDIEAWPHGPVVRDLYIEFNDVGRKEITRPAYNYDGSQPSLNGAPDSTRELLEAVWANHNRYKGTRLSNATHLPGEPWTIIRDRYGDLSRKPRIPNELIEQRFKAKFASAS